MNNDVVLYLPFPPTVNSYYKVTMSGQRYLDKRVVGFREQVEKAINEQAPNLHLDERLFMEVYLFPPDRRKRDVDNYMKGLLDALTKAEIWEDDCLIDQLHIYRGEIVKGGSVRVELAEAGPILAMS